MFGLSFIFRQTQKDWKKSNLLEIQKKLEAV